MVPLKFSIVVTAKVYSVMEVVKAFSKFLNKEIKYKFDLGEGDSQMIVADVEKFDKFFLFGDQKSNNLEKIIKTAFEWEKIK